MRSRSRATVLVAVGISVPAATGAPAASDEARSKTVFGVTSVSFDIAAGDRVGVRRSGSFCLPAGTIGWRDAKPDMNDARETIASASRDAGVAVRAPDNPFGQGASGVDRAIVVRVKAVHLSACVPPGGLGRLLNRSRVVRGSGQIAVAWRVFGREQDAPMVEAVTCTAFTYRGDPGTLAEMTLEGLRLAATRFAAGLREGPPSAAGAKGDSCRASRNVDGSADADQSRR